MMKICKEHRLGNCTVCESPKVMREGYVAEKLRKAKELSKKSEKRFLNTLLNICVLNAMVDWSAKDPKQEFKDVAELLIVYMHASEIEVDK